MAKRSEKTVLFLCTGNYYRSRFSEVLFNSVAGKLGLAWKATSRALALERGVNNVGPMAKLAVQHLQQMGIQDAPAYSRMPQSVTDEELALADFVIALKEAEHLPLLQERHPAATSKVEFWTVEDEPTVLEEMQREVMYLTSRLLMGGSRRDPSSPQLQPEKPATASAAKGTSGKGITAKVGRETKGRNGKGVTTVFDLPLDDAGLSELCKTLKQRCGTGGTVKEKVIEIQGDQRERICTELEKMGYKVKRVGG